MPSCLITGGCGFIGRHLVRLLLARGERVRVLDLADGPAEEHPAVELIRASTLDSAAVERALRGIDRLYHLAAVPHLWSADKGQFERVNHRGTEVVLTAAARADLERIVHCSTYAVLVGRRRLSGQAVDETALLGSDDMAGPYCRSKCRAEHAALAAARRGLPVVVVNPTAVLGPGDDNLTPPTEMLRLLLNGGPGFFLDCPLNFVDVRDVALGHLLAAERGRIGERYLLGGTNLTMRQLLALLSGLTGLPMPRRAIPPWVALAVAHVSETLADHVTHRPPTAPLTGVRLALQSAAVDAGKAARELGLAPRPLAETLADAIGWLHAHGHLRRPLGRVALAPG